MRLILCLIVFLSAVRNTAAQNESDIATRAVDLKPLLLEAEAKFKSDLRAGRGTGHIVESLRGRLEDEPTMLLESEFSLAFDEERFRIDIRSHSRTLADEKSPSVTLFSRQSLLFDGKQHYLVQYTDNETVQGLIYDRNWTEYLLGKVHFPCPKPAQLWFSAHELVCGTGFRYQTKSLNQSGIYAYFAADNARMEVKCYLMPPAPFALSRVTLTHNQQTLREFNLDWKDTEGIRYVNRFSSREAEAGKPQERYSSLEFSQFEVNPALSQSEFELKTLGIPKGTRFQVKVPVPATYIYDGVEFQREIQRN